MVTYAQQQAALITRRVSTWTGPDPELVWIGDSHVERYMGDKFAGKRVFCAGIGGGTAFDLWSGIPFQTIFGRWPNPLVLVMTGTNEVNQNISPADPNWIAAVRYIVDRCMQNNRRVWLASDPPPAFFGQGAPLGPDKFAAIRDVLRSIATNAYHWSGVSTAFPASFPLQWIDFWGALQTDPNWPGYCSDLDTNDTIHRSPLGYQRMSDHAAQVIK